MSLLLRSASLLALASLALAASAQNLVKDPGFESAGNGGTISYSTGQTIDGGFWTVYDSPANTFYVTTDPAIVISGAKSVFFFASVQQTLATSAAAPYLVSFDAYGQTSNSAVTVAFGGSTTGFAIPQNTSQNPPAPVTHFSFLQTATASSTVLSFKTVGGAFVLDNVSVTPVPEPSALLALAFPMLELLRRRRRA